MLVWGSVIRVNVGSIFENPHFLVAYQQNVVLPNGRAFYTSFHFWFQLCVGAGLAEDENWTGRRLQLLASLYVRFFMRYY